MIDWLILLSLSIITALLLTFKSMGKYRELSSNFSQEYALYLVQKPESLTSAQINYLHRIMLYKRFIFSYERLQRGDQKACVVFGPKVILEPLVSELGLLELEDYTKNIDLKNITIWEMAFGKKIDDAALKRVVNGLSESLGKNEQLWLQLVTQPKGKSAFESIQVIMHRLFGFGTATLDKVGAGKAKVPPVFYCIIRLAVVGSDSARAEQLGLEAAKSSKNALLKLLPALLTTKQKLMFYQDRALPIAQAVQSLITADKIISAVLD